MSGAFRFLHAALPFAGLVVYSTWLRRGMLRALEVSPDTLRIHFWFKRPVDVPWTDVLRPDSYPERSAFKRFFSGPPIYVSRRYGGVFWLPGPLEDMGDLYEEISRRARF